jgi:hypothetical protein
MYRYEILHKLQIERLFNDLCCQRGKIFKVCWLGTTVSYEKGNTCESWELWIFQERWQASDIYTAVFKNIEHFLNNWTSGWFKKADKPVKMAAF